MNILWVNSLGGVDSYLFVNPQDSLTVTRNSVKKNTWKIHDGIYTDVIDSIYNVSDEIFNTNSVVTIKAYTRFLEQTDEVYWLAEMIASKQLFLELTNNKLVPTSVTNNTFTYQRQKYLSGAVNVMQFDFTLPENIIPGLSSKRLSYILSTKFYNDERVGYFRKSSCPAGII